MSYGYNSSNFKLLNICSSTVKYFVVEDKGEKG